MGEVSLVEMKQISFRTLASANFAGLVFFGGLLFSWLYPRQMPAREIVLIVCFTAGAAFGILAAIRGPLRLLGIWFLLLNVFMIATIISGVSRPNH
jgi:hypothetical protein